MKKLLFSALLGLAMLTFTGCVGDEKSETEKVEESTMKCEAGKCGEGKCGSE